MGPMKNEWGGQRMRIKTCEKMVFVSREERCI